MPISNAEYNSGQIRRRCLIKLCIAVLHRAELRNTRPCEFRLIKPGQCFYYIINDNPISYEKYIRISIETQTNCMKEVECLADIHDDSPKEWIDVNAVCIHNSDPSCIPSGCTTYFPDYELVFVENDTHK